MITLGDASCTVEFHTQKEHGTSTDRTTGTITCPFLQVSTTTQPHYADTLTADGVLVGFLLLFLILIQTARLLFKNDA